MKILHYALGFPPYRTGGLTRYVIDLAKEQIQQGDTVKLMWPGRMTGGKSIRFIRKKSTDSLPESIEMVNPLPVPLLEGVRDVSAFTREGKIDPFLRLLQDEKPDVIHIHTFMGLYTEFLMAAKQLQIRIVFTTHDYYPLCPKVNLICRGRECTLGMSDAGCSSCDMSPLGVPKIMLMQSPLYRWLKDSVLVKCMRKNYKLQRQQDTKEAADVTNIYKGNMPQEELAYSKLQQYYGDMLKLVDIVHCNSNTAKEIYQNLSEVESVKVVSISNYNIVDKRQKKVYNRLDKLQITYLGPASAYKGFFVLQDALDELETAYANRFELHVYVSVAEPRHYMKVHPPFANDELDVVLQKSDLLVIPSVWRETFGFVVLEALSRGVPVIVTENVGAKDLVIDGENGFITKAEKRALANVIERFVQEPTLLAQMNEFILGMDFPYTMEAHAREIRAKIYS